MSKKAYIQNLIDKETKRGKTERELIGISVTKTIAQEYKNLCKIEDISQGKILVEVIKDFIEIKKLSQR
jgi:hypothetical protein